MFDIITLVLLKYAYELHKYFWILGLLNGAFLLSINAEEKTASKIFWAVIAVISLLPNVGWLIIGKLSSIAGIDYVHGSWLAFLAWLVCAGLSWLGAVWWLRHGVHKAEILRKKYTKTSALERNKKTDVRNIFDFLPPNKKAFDPLKYINMEKGVFVGLDEYDAPIYINRGDWNTRHFLLSGMTRSGKGVAAQILGIQSIQMGELFVVLDPKCDNWMPHIYEQACKKLGKTYHFLDLRQNAHEQINIFAGADAETIENILIGAFSLAPKGENADHYRLGDRKAARRAAQFVEDMSKKGETVTASDIVAKFSSIWEDTDKRNMDAAAGFSNSLRELAELRSINRTKGGIDINKLAEEGGCLYVVGDMMNSRIITVQRLLLARLMMLAKNRDTINAKHRNIRLFADEFRVHISRAFILSLGMSAGWGLLSILGFQSFEDLRDCPADLDADMVKGAVMENCAIKLSYKISDHETAERIAATTGEILVDAESRHVEKNMALTETIGDRSISQKERFLMDTNMIHNLAIPVPENGTIGCGVLIGAKTLAQFCFTSPVKVERSQSAITPTIDPPEAPPERILSLHEHDLELLPDD